MSIVLETHDLTKSFSGLTVVNNISIAIERGEIFGILGENGAGKSTLLKMICGVYQPSSGSLAVDGDTHRIESPMRAKQLGISMIPQEFNLVDSLSVFENVFLGNEIRKGLLLNKRAMRERTQTLLHELETDLDPNAQISTLSVAQKQMVEIAKALVFDAHILVMDEPTTVLTNHEVDVLFGLMNKLKAKGVTILFISHKLKEIKRMCDRLLVMRDGDLVSVDPVSEITEHDMARKMVGRELNQIFPERSLPNEALALTVQGLSIPGQLRDINFELRKGEVLGFAGLVGAGRTEVAEAVMGLRPATIASIAIQGKTISLRNVADAMRHKLAYLSEDRQGKGLVMPFGIEANTTLMSLKNYTRLLINKRKEREVTQGYVDQFSIRAANRKGAVRYLSGGNQQKVYLSKLMDTAPEILILDEPTRGIDLNAKRDIYHFIHELTQQGLSVIVISSELEEIIGLCHRVMVMREGRIAGRLEGEHINEEEIMYYAAGLKDNNEQHVA